MVESEGNLTGGQIQEVMDNLLYGALEPVIRYTNVFDTQLAYLLASVTKNKKRKVCAIKTREAIIDYLCKALGTKDPDLKLQYIKKLKIERSFIHVFLKRFVAKYKQPFLDLYYLYMSDHARRKEHAARIQPYINNVGCTSRSEMFIALTSCESNLDKFYFYFDKVISQYYKLCYTKAKFLMDSNPNNNYDFNDLVQNLRRKTVIALNKYDASNGALTSYIKWWFFNSLTCGSGEHEYGLAYTVPQNHKRKLMDQNNSSMNFSISMDTSVSRGEEGEATDLHMILAGETEELDEEVASQSALDKLYLVAKNADPFGIARLSLDIPEVFSAQELAKMKRTTVLKAGNL